MGTINRYIISELLKTFVFALLVMMPVLIVFGIVQQLLTKSVPLDRIPLLIPHIVVSTAPISFPMALLLAVTTFFSGMSGSNEVVALKSLGIPPRQILWPVMVLGVVVSLLSVWLNDLAVTWGRPGITAILYRATEDIILNELKTKGTVTSSGATIVVKGVDENRRLLSPSITVNKPPTNIEARNASLRIDFLRSEVIIDFSGMKIDTPGHVRYSTENRKIAIPLKDFWPLDDRIGPSETGLQDIPIAIADIESHSAGLQRHMAAHQAFICCFGSVDEWADSGWRTRLRRINDNQKQINRFEVEPPRRWSSGFCCLFFIWLGAPLAIWMNKSDAFASFFACFVPILIFYYPLFTFGLKAAKDGTLPSAAVWIGNLCLATAGYWFWKRIHRY